MTVVVRTVARIIAPMILAFGGYVIMHGHLTPGGGFQGGAVAASALALLAISFGFGRWKGIKAPLSFLEDLGALAFVALGFLGIGYTFFRNVLAASGGLFGAPVPPGPNPGLLETGGTLPLMNWAVGLKVIAGLGSVVLLLGLFGGEDDR
ncbi:MAG: Na+/H+ antiporter MnhB subunit-like protein [Acetothermia bacterium 64_32]|nr:MAG: Na+/H+ antiporter MnhB subunit-like protein [Acetothermia bacterium 64_32]HAF71469.1 sodium:proton antiporter [Candidatus Acetothermia bacterium]